jgi:hypothetical protein
MVLLVCYDHPRLQQLQPLNMKETIIQAINSLMVWYDVPFMEEPMHRIQRVAKSKGLWAFLPELFIPTLLETRSTVE